MQYFFVFGDRIAVGNDPGRRLPPRPAVAYVNAAQRNARIEVAAERPAPYAAGVKAARNRLHPVDNLHRANLGRSGDGTGRKSRAEQIQPVVTFAQDRKSTRL